MEMPSKTEEAVKQIFIIKKDVVALSGKKWQAEQKLKIRAIDDKTGYQVSFEPNGVKDVISIETVRKIQGESISFFLQPQVIIPYKSEIVPDGAYIYEFAHPEEHFNTEGNYVQHFPGFIKNLKSRFKLDFRFQNRF